MRSVQIYRGITYATYERFKHPVINRSWAVGYDKEKFGIICPQRSSRLSSLLGDGKLPEIGEGRLCLTVYAPENADKLPVMLWIHGGAFVSGGSEEPRYSGERLVQAGNLIVVKISYRLGVFGFLYDPENGIENLGLQDQITALQWVYDYISEFGGDNQRITVFGQSAGALSIAGLIAISNGKPYFNRAILQSAPLGIPLTADKAIRITKRFKSILGKDIYEASVDEILDAQDVILKSSVGLSFCPILKDFTFLPTGLDVEVFAGYTSDDVSPFVLPVLGSLYHTFIGRLVTRVLTWYAFALPVKRYVKMFHKRGLGAKLYTIEWSPAGNVMGSCHCIELPFLLGEFADWEHATMLRGMTQSEYNKNSEVCLKVWTDFATNGIFPDSSTPVI